MPGTWFDGHVLSEVEGLTTNGLDSGPLWQVPLFRSAAASRYTVQPF